MQDLLCNGNSMQSSSTAMHALLVAILNTGLKITIQALLLNNTNILLLGYIWLRGFI